MLTANNGNDFYERISRNFTHGIVCNGCLLLLVTCVKEYGYEGGKGTASYSFSGAPDACTGAVVAAITIKACFNSSQHRNGNRVCECCGGLLM